MRRKRVVLLAALVTVAASFVVVGKGATAPPLAPDYHWAQPWCAPVAIPHAQPPAGIPIATPVVPAVPGSSYAWVQPGCAPVTTPHAQP